MLHPQDKNVIGTKIENCSIPPFKQGMKFVLVSTVYAIYCRITKGNETKSVCSKQRTAKIKPQKIQKKLLKSQKSKKKSFSILSHVCL